MSRVILCALLLGALPLCVVAREKKVCRTADAKLEARIVSVGKKDYEANESRVEIRTIGGRLLRFRGFASDDGEHGYGVFSAAWSADDRFFVFQLDNSGGHQPWHQPIYFYSRERNRFYNLEDFIGSTTRGFRIVGGDTIIATRYDFASGSGTPVRVRLDRLPLFAQ